MKKIGALLAISSLPSNFGIGDLGTNAYKFIDILKKKNCKIWQVLPLTPLGFGNSPYQSYSSFAGDEIYISIEKLLEDKLLEKGDIKTFNSKSNKVDYINVRNYKKTILKKAFINFKKNKKYFLNDYEKFLKENNWLFTYSIFRAFKKINNNEIWTNWQDDFKSWTLDSKQIDLSIYEDLINYNIFLQFIFYKQWFELKQYANSKGIEIMGDLPIYLGLDSVDVWQNQDIFQLSQDGNPTFVAGVPPDFFSKTGQLWGNPLYDWDKLKDTNYEFWIDRLKGNFNLFDIVRIDHFRAFDTYWKIPAKEKTAINGEWIEAPGYDFFDRVYKEIPNANIIAEDLGDLREEVFKLRDHYNLKGMKIFQFHFDYKNSLEFEKEKNCIVYTGTHDNNTLLGWYNELSKWQQKQLKKFFKANNKNIINKIIKYSISSTQAEYVILPIQDILNLDKNARLNTPGKLGSPNWEWKLIDFSLLN